MNPLVFVYLFFQVLDFLSFYLVTLTEYGLPLMLPSPCRSPGNGGPASTGTTLPSEEDEGGCPPGSSS